MRRSFTLEDFRSHLRSMSRLGRAHALDRLPEVASLIQDKETLLAALPRRLGILDAMTPAERADSALPNSARVDEIAADSGASPEEVRRLIKSCENVRREMELMDPYGGWRRIWYLLGWKPFPPVPPPS
jgi:signal recognition particle subunit SRP54